MKIAYGIISSVLALSAAASLCGCTSQGEEQTTDMQSETSITQTDAETQAVPHGPGIRAVSPENGQTVSLLNEEMTKWLSAYKPARLDKIFDFTEKCEPVPVTLRWENDYSPLYSHVLISRSADMSDPAIYLCAADQLEVRDLYAGVRYYWQLISECGDKTVASAVFTFETAAQPRTVAIDGVSNARDIGGYPTKDGKRIKQGVVYRGADFSKITAEGINKAVNVLGIKTELDLRDRNKKGPSPLGESVKLIAVSAPWYGGAFEEGYRQDLINELRVFTDQENFPVYFHCSLGRDRTGTLAFLLLALCGVEKNDIYKDYEVSFFSDFGGYDDKTQPSFMVNSNLDAFRKSILSKTKEKDLQAAVRSYLISVGMTEAELDAIVDNLTEAAQ